MKILAFETSCDDTSVSIVQGGRKVLSSCTASQISEHTLYGGVVPEIASRRHCESIKKVCEETFKKAYIDLKDIDAVAATYTPGLIGSLLVGLNFAKGICLSKNLPLVPVHHLRGHVASLYISNEGLSPPFLCMIVSGGHTHIVDVRDYTEMAVIAKTRDDAAGETFDKIAKHLGLPYPGGIYIDKIASKGNPYAYKNIPRPEIENNKYDFSFSGIKTFVINIINDAKNKGQKINTEDMAASVRFAVIDYMVSKFIMAAKKLRYQKLAICGGVSANILFRDTMNKECEKLGFKFFMPKLEFCGDNAAMIGSQGYYEYIEGNTSSLDINAFASKDIAITIEEHPVFHDSLPAISWERPQK
ncbi:MAG: tRNA (adenosine(37)-N6)-threonylcarbamoyltransferase complex transferase subunit TsaD [Oscillospiraceae bacterium]|nr:tRNA (adenosine(37)-N6)-threonylcarbamoyltransferase complex transferase subunit TsaD [Oscillospiraceae bacterium]